MDTLIFQQNPEVELAGNKFLNVPIILQYEDTPLIEVVKAVEAGFTTQIPIYHSDGTYLAKVVGTQIYPTEAGVKAGITLKYPDKMTVCEMDGKTLFEIKRVTAAAVKAQAELFTPDGRFLKLSDTEMGAFKVEMNKNVLKIGSVTMIGNKFVGCKIGILYDKNGGVMMGVNR